MKILYCGDGPIQGPAVYLYCVLNYLGHKVYHVAPEESLTQSQLLKSKADVLILSDFHHSHLKSEESLIVQRVQEKGMGLLMVGGWGSFFGGGYAGSKIEKLLPIKIKTKDDRINYSPGLRVFPTEKNNALRGLFFNQGPVICGLNQVSSKEGSRTLLGGFPLILMGDGAVKASSRSYPVLVTGKAGQGRTAAFTTDFAPHWAGGLLDWGKRRVKIRVAREQVGIEVGDNYVRFIQQLVQWLSVTDDK